ncbi:MAG: FG-GAP-like repeat-containing protein [Pseudomonadota bacterium]
MSILLALSAANVNAFSEGSHAVYVGDLNGDGIDDVYLKANSKVATAPLGRLFAIPFQTEDSYVVYSETTPTEGYDDPLVDNDLSVAGLERLDTIPQLTDYNGDGELDIVVAAPRDTLIPLVVQDGTNQTTELLFSGNAVDPANDTLSGNTFYGAIRGQFSVAKDGSANYVIPIEVPPGIDGVQPELSLNYNSNRGNGVLGWGWSIGGLSMITRCRATLIRDGYYDGINDNDNYKYCLDGQRLVRIGSNEYRTESEIYSKIWVDGTDNGKPVKWRVQLRDGRELHYGGGVGATRISSSSNERYEWHLQKIETQAQLAVTYEYTNGISSGVHKLHRILYTQNATSHNSTNKEILFEYEARPDDILRYSAGSKIFEDQRLDRIRIRSENTDIRNFTFDYQVIGQAYNGSVYDDPNSTSRIASIKLCFGGVSSTSCAEETVFDWSSSENELAEIQGFFDGATVPAIEDYYFHDEFDVLEPNVTGAALWSTAAYSPYTNVGSFTGDLKQSVIGLSDDTLYWVENGSSVRESLPNAIAGSWQECAAFEGGSTQSICRTKEWEEAAQIILDLNGDGQDDIFLVSPGARGQGAKAFLRTGSTFVESTGATSYQIPNQNDLSYQVSYTHISGVYTNRVNYRLAFRDFNGDGLVDLLRYPALSPSDITIHSGQKYDVSVAINTGSGFSSFASWLNISNTPDFFSYTNVGDVNGDGLPDLVAINGTVALNTGSSSLSVDTSWRFGSAGNNSSISFMNGIPPYLLDFNGDGLQDMVTVADSGTVTVALSTGDAFEETYSQQMTISQSSASGQPQLWAVVTDINGDGLPDLVAKRIPTNALGINFHAYASKQYNVLGAFQAYVDVAINDGNGGYHSFVANYFMDPANNIGTIKVNNANNEIVSISSIEGADVDISYGPMDPFNRNASYEPTFEAGPIYSQSAISAPYNGLSNTSQPTVTLNGGFTTVEMSTSHLSRRHSAPRAVASYEVGDAAGGTRDYEMSYEDGMFHKTGYGSLGFAKVDTRDVLQPNVFRLTSREYSQEAVQDYNLAGRLLRETQTVSTQAGTADDTVVRDRRVEWKVRIYKDDQDTSAGGYDSPHFFPYRLSDYTAISELTDGQELHTKVDYVQSGQSYTNCNEPTNFSTKMVLATNSSANDDVDEYGTAVYTGTKFCDSSGTSGLETHNGAIANITTSGKWILGLVEDRNVTHFAADDGAASANTELRETDYSYYPATGGGAGSIPGRLHTETREPNATDETLSWTKTYTYNLYGGLASEAQSWNSTSGTANDSLDFTTRTTAYNETYDNFGIREIVTTRPEVGSSTDVFEVDFGNLSSSTDINNLVTNYSYDALGRIDSIDYSDGTVEEFDYRQCNGCFSPWNTNTRYYEQSKLTGNSAVRTYYDASDRVVGTRNRGLDGDYIYTSQTYTRDGIINSDTAGHKLASDIASRTTSYLYDEVNRIKRMDFANNSFTTNSYSSSTEGARSILETDALGKTRTVYYDARQRARLVEDHQGTQITYEYTPQGDLGNVEVDPNGMSITTAIEYDVLRRKTKLTDPDMGVIDYQYNSLDLLSEQEDAEGQVTLYKYDALGRTTQRTDDATGVPQVHNWNFDSAVDGIGLLASVVGVDTEARNYQESYTYNEQSLRSSTTTTIDGSSFTSTTHYDDYYREAGQSYPGTGFTLAMHYNAYGAISEYRSAITQQVLWQATDNDGRGQITDYSLGNGIDVSQAFVPETGLVDTIVASNGGFTAQDHDYDFDVAGNLKQRKDKRAGGGTQNFCYDDLHRLTGLSYGSSSCASNTDFTYDILGNLKSNLSTPGTFNYGDLVGGNLLRPHALTSVVNGASATNYNYNDKGEMVSGDNRTISYTTFGKPTVISESGSGTTVTFVYGSDKNRVERQEGTEFTTYLGATEKVTDGDLTKYKHYVGDFAIFTQEQGASSDSYYTYLHRDHLGSIVAQTGELGNSSDFIELGIGPWGERQDWTGNSVDQATATLITDRGFTDHEHVDSVGLIHMNGRAYDPLLARFVSPDPDVQAAYDLQNFNRYSYVLNNPLKYTDPTGQNFASVCTTTIFGTTGSATYGNFVRSVLGFGCVTFGAVNAGALAVGTAIAAALHVPAVAGPEQTECPNYPCLDPSIATVTGMFSEGTSDEESGNDRDGDEQSSEDQASEGLSKDAASGSDKANREDRARKNEQREKRNRRREARSRGPEGNGQNQKDSNPDRARGRKEANKGPTRKKEVTTSRQSKNTKTQRGRNRQRGDDASDSKAEQKERGERRSRSF